jgi:hypothetical protein
VAENLRQLLKEQLRVDTFEAINREGTTVGVTAQRLLRQTPYRVAVHVVNLSAATFHAGPFRNPSSSKGITIGPGGGNLVLVWYEDFTLVGQEWFIVSDAAAAAIHTQELLLIRPEEEPAVAG